MRALTRKLVVGLPVEGRQVDVRQLALGQLRAQVPADDDGASSNRGFVWRRAQDVKIGMAVCRSVLEANAVTVQSESS